MVACVSVQIRLPNFDFNGLAYFSGPIIVLSCNNLVVVHCQMVTKVLEVLTHSRESAFCFFMFFKPGLKCPGCLTYITQGAVSTFDMINDATLLQHRSFVLRFDQVIPQHVIRFEVSGDSVFSVYSLELLRYTLNIQGL